MSDEELTGNDLDRLIEALRQMPDADDPDLQEQWLDSPVNWVSDRQGNWSPVYADGRVGAHSFSFTQMAAFRGGDLGPFLEALIAAQIVPDNTRVGLDVFSEAWKGVIDGRDFESTVSEIGPDSHEIPGKANRPRPGLEPGLQRETRD
ncbi:hypothetical protein [Nocardia abscessus]|uniref:hypothetical protein n=1 Tax=Nocardia abscessus TaxID=120957 RepID=UPI0024560827|nr:hypothetical protein [Nocardia abscessus]